MSQWDPKGVLLQWLRGHNRQSGERPFWFQCFQQGASCYCSSQKVSRVLLPSISFKTLPSSKALIGAARKSPRLLMSTWTQQRTQDLFFFISIPWWDYSERRVVKPPCSTFRPSGGSLSLCARACLSKDAAIPSSPPQSYFTARCHLWPPTTPCLNCQLNVKWGSFCVSHCEIRRWAHDGADIVF